MLTKLVEVDGLNMRLKVFFGKFQAVIYTVDEENTFCSPYVCQLRCQNANYTKIPSVLSSSYYFISIKVSF